jgi:predicted HicB family RNase H-like nuclease
MSEQTKHRKRMGRPPFPKGQAKYTPVVFRVNPDFKKALVAAARRRNQRVPDFIRDCLTDVLSREGK